MCASVDVFVMDESNLFEVCTQAHISGSTHFRRYTFFIEEKWNQDRYFWSNIFEEEKKVKINIPGAISLDPNPLATAQITPFFRRVDRRHRHCGSTFSSHLCQGNFFLLFLKGGTGGARGLSFINAFLWMSYSGILTVFTYTLTGRLCLLSFVIVTVLKILKGLIPFFCRCQLSRSRIVDLVSLWLTLSCFVSKSLTPVY